MESFPIFKQARLAHKLCPTPFHKICNFQATSTKGDFTLLLRHSSPYLTKSPNLHFSNPISSHLQQHLTFCIDICVLTTKITKLNTTKLQQEGLNFFFFFLSPYCTHILQLNCLVGFKFLNKIQYQSLFRLWIPECCFQV